MQSSSAALSCIALAALAGCGGSGEGLDTNGRPVSGAGPEAPLTADLASIQQHVFTPICTQCHTGAAAPLGFRLDADSSYAMLVNAPSVEVPALMRVNPGHPDSSYLVQKLEGHAAVGGQMPLGQSPLPQSTIDMIRQWITDGALQGAAPATSKIAASARLVTPAAGEMLTRSNGDLLVAVDGGLDSGLFDPATVTVVRSGGDGTFGDGNEQTVPGARVQLRSTEPIVFAIIVPPSARVPDVYRVNLPRLGPEGTDLVIDYSIEDLP